jgi:hypothetical protein
MLPDLMKNPECALRTVRCRRSHDSAEHLPPNTS